MKTLNEIYDGMRLDFVRRTGSPTGDECDLAARMYALAAQIYALQVQGEWVKRQSFPQTAQGEYLDYHARMRGLERRPAQYAQGVVRIFMAESSSVMLGLPRGAVVVTDDLQAFETTEHGVIPPGQMWVDVPVKARKPGAAGNIPPGAITRFAVPPVGGHTCTNLEAFEGGAEEEGDEELRARVLESCRQLPNGGNAAYYRRLMFSDSEVAKVVVVPRPRGVGSVDLVVSTREGGLLYSDQRRLQELLDREREIAVDAKVKAPALKSCRFQIQVKPKEGYDLQEVIARVEAAITAIFTGEMMGVNIPLVRLGSLIYGCEGVENYRILQPTEDIEVEETMQPRLGALTVEEMT